MKQQLRYRMRGWDGLQRAATEVFKCKGAWALGWTEKRKGADGVVEACWPPVSLGAQAAGIRIQSLGRDERKLLNGIAAIR